MKNRVLWTITILAAILFFLTSIDLYYDFNRSLFTVFQWGLSGGWILLFTIVNDGGLKV